MIKDDRLGNEELVLILTQFSICISFIMCYHYLFFTDKDSYAVHLPSGESSLVPFFFICVKWHQ
jgi:hypothetical protein